MYGKILSLIISLVYLIISYFAGGGELLIKTFIYLLLPLFCIWQNEGMGNYKGILHMPAITETSPSVVIKYFGWFLLLFPVLLPLILYLMQL